MMRCPHALLAAIALSGLYIPSSAEVVLTPKQVPAGSGGNTISALSPDRDAYVSPDAMMLGGTSDMASSHLYIRGLPYGPYDTGALVSAVMTDRPIYGSRAGIGPDGFGQEVGYGSVDVATIFNQATATPARVTASSAFVDPADGKAHAVTYDATHAYFRPPLPAAKVALLRRKMYALTNAVDRTDRPRLDILGRADPHGRYQLNMFMGQVQSWDPGGASVTVDGWVVPGGGNAAAGQVPGARYDTVRSNFGAAAIFLGAATKSFNRNTFCNLDPLGKAGSEPSAPDYANNPIGTIGAQQLECEADETDLVDNGTVDFQNTLHGYTVQYTPNGIVPAANGKPAHNVSPSSASWGFHSGGPLPHHFVADELPDVPSYEANAFGVYGAGGPAYGSPVGTRATSLEADKYANGAVNYRFSVFEQRDKLNANAPRGSDAGQATHSTHVALIEGGTKGDAASGTIQSQIVMNGPNFSGSWGVCPYGFDGSDGSQCPLGVYGGSGLIKMHRPWLDMRTPTSSSDPCVAGEFTDDANFHYVCVSANKWRRVALSDF